MGPPGSGKTTIADALVEMTGGERLSFAQGVKDEIVAAISAIDGPEAGAEALLQMADPETKDGWRALLQAWGTDFRRAQNTHYWLDKLHSRLTEWRAAAPPLVVVDDCRFPNEYDLLREVGFVFVQLLPGEQTREQTEDIAAHESERYWPEFEVDYRLAYEPGPQRQAETLLSLLRKSGY